MAKERVQVFVDDYVLGRLPPVCAVTGQPTTDQVEFRSNVSPLNPLWVLLLFLGPIGWIILLFVAWSGSNYLTGWLPYSHQKAHRVTDQRRLAVVGGVIGVVALLLLGGALEAPIFVGLAVLAAVGGLVAFVVINRIEPRFELDASGRWVTIRNVHPNFAAAVASRQSGETEHSLRLS